MLKMSAVLMMTDTWQPTVLRLVPFSSNNARSPDRKGYTKGTMSARNFPVLAVTRSSANSDQRSDAKSVNSHRSELADDISVFSDANLSEITTKTGYTDQTTTTNKHRQKYAKKKVPEIYSEMKEAIKFSVQDLNDQISSSSSLNSSENRDENKDKYNKLDNTRTKLQKPSVSASPDARFCSPVNGVRRSVPLTPGELELQRIRDSYYVEQVQKRKKYKLNINQLPRSTTPINDHDPDKLNMKQVIAFLQTKTSKDMQKKILSAKRGHPGTPNGRNQSRGKADSSPVSPTRALDKDNGKVLSRSNTDIKSEERIEPDNTRVNTGCVSVMSTKSTPNLSFGTKISREPKVTATHSVKSYKERSKDRKHSKHKPMKEFKLYRFLSIAPDGRSEGLATSFADAVPVVEPSFLKTESKSQESPRKLLRKRNNREIGTAHVLHRHASSRTTVTAPKTETKESTEEQNKTIRLPIMVDGDNEIAEIESDSGSTTSATCNSVQNSSTREDRSRYPKKGKSISFNDNIEVNVSEKVSENDTQNSYSDFSIRNFKPPSFPRVDISGPKHIHINLPQEDKKNYSQEIVRLTLRHEKNATRVTSYMSDIQQSSSPQWHAHYTNEPEADIPEGSKTPVKYMNYHEKKQWFDNSKHLINNLSNNNFIKVREKLRTSNQYNSE